jgi:hypothetical protein
MTYKSYLTCVDERFCREPFPHERARRPVIDRIDQPANIVVDLSEGKIKLIELLVLHGKKKNCAHTYCTRDAHNFFFLRTFELQRVRSPALLLRHNVRHSLTATANARDADGRSFKFGDVLVFRLNAGYDRPKVIIHHIMMVVSAVHWRHY